MKVRAVLSGNKIHIEPDPVTVLVGEPLYWEFSSALQNPRIKWEVYFQHSDPFGPGLSNLVSETIPTVIAGVHRPPHQGLSASVVATAPGDHKYGIRAHDAVTLRQLADDDPILRIIP